jgi:CheY-like chemotaxis protein
MERQLRQMTRLIDDLLDVNRISQGKIDLRREKVELASVVCQVVEAARPACASAHQELTVTLPSQPVFLNADPVRLTQVFGNLLHNSCRFTKPGGRISLTAERQGDDVVVTVQESGIGIPSDLLPKVFELFTQGDQRLERSHSGLGIGLTLVQRLVELHGGSVQASSEGVDRGSEFVVRLPVLIEKQKALSQNPTVGEPTSLMARRILVADDNHEAAETLAIVLRLTGHHTHLAFDGVEAVEAAMSFRPDVILMDIGMPKLNGYDAAYQIREQEWGKGIMLVALTGWGQDEDRTKSAAAGFDHHMVKPVDYATLTRLLATSPVIAAEASKT